MFKLDIAKSPNINCRLGIDFFIIIFCYFVKGTIFDEK